MMAFDLAGGHFPGPGSEPEKRKPPRVFQAQFGAFKGENVIEVRLEDNLYYIRTEDLMARGLQHARREYDQGCIIDEPAFFSVGSIVSNETFWLHLNRDTFAFAYNSLLQRKWPITDYGRNPNAPPEMRL